MALVVTRIMHVFMPYPVQRVRPSQIQKAKLQQVLVFSNKNKTIYLS